MLEKLAELVNTTIIVGIEIIRWNSAAERKKSTVL